MENPVKILFGILQLKTPFLFHKSNHMPVGTKRMKIL